MTTDTVTQKLDAIRNIAAIGAGSMGPGTALAFAMAGYEVQFYARREEGLQEGLGVILRALEDYRDNNHLVRDKDIPQVMDRIHPTTDLQRAGENADFVIESIAEDLAVKQKIFGELDKIAPKHAIFASNSSSLSPTAIAGAITRPDKFVITHFWNPPHLLPAVEVVPGAETSPETMDIAYDLMERIGKQPVRLNREILGFIGNRLQAALLREACHLAESGIASPEAIDKVVRTSLGRRLAMTGPLESADIGGLHIFKSIFEQVGPDLCNDTGVPPLLEQAVARGHLGAKTGRGLYDWAHDKLAEISHARVTELFRHLARDVVNSVHKPKQSVAGLITGSLAPPAPIMQPDLPALQPAAKADDGPPVR